MNPAETEAGFPGVEAGISFAMVQSVGTERFLDKLGMTAMDDKVRLAASRLTATNGLPSWGDFGRHVRDALSRPN
jgi:hypothetical protein